MAVLHQRTCGSVVQYVWIRMETPESLAGAALSDLQSQLLTPPQARLAPPDRAVVNLETWLAAADVGPVSATAAVPGLSSTVTARISSTTFDLGNGDRITCPGVGTAWKPSAGDQPAPCGYTFRRLGAGDTNVVGITLTWSVTWTASNGSTGSLPSVDSATAQIAYPVTEIQTIGVEG